MLLSVVLNREAEDHPRKMVHELSTTNSELGSSPHKDNLPDLGDGNFILPVAELNLLLLSHLKSDTAGTPDDVTFSLWPDLSSPHHLLCFHLVPTPNNFDLDQTVASQEIILLFPLPSIVLLAILTCYLGWAF